MINAHWQHRLVGLYRQATEAKHAVACVEFCDSMRGCSNTPDLGMRYLYLCRFLRSLIGVQANTVAEPKANVAGPNKNGAISEQTFYNWKRELRRALAAFRKPVPRVKLPLHDLSSDEIVAGLHNATLELGVILKPTGEHSNAFISCSVTLPMPPVIWSLPSVTPYCAQRKVPSKLLCGLSNLSYEPNRDAEGATDVVPRPGDYVCKERAQRTQRKFLP
jgi:hypothetical protein